jgi:hypothetical protein
MWQKGGSRADTLRCAPMEPTKPRCSRLWSTFLPYYFLAIQALLLFNNHVHIFVFKRLLFFPGENKPNSDGKCLRVLYLLWVALQGWCENGVITQGQGYIIGIYICIILLWGMRHWIYTSRQGDGWWSCKIEICKRNRLIHMYPVNTDVTTRWVRKISLIIQRHV